MSAQNREKLTHPLCPKNVRTDSTPPLLCPSGRSISFEKSKIFALKSANAASEDPLTPCPQNVRTGHWTNSLLTADVLWIAPEVYR